MKCPYCNKTVKDVPNHLDKTLNCSKLHGENLLEQFKTIFAFDVALSKVERISTCTLCHGTGTKTALDVGEYDDMLIEYPCSCTRKDKEVK